MSPAQASSQMSKQNNAYQVRIPSLVFSVIAPLFVALRFWSRIQLKKALGADDWTILFSLICAFSVNVLMLVASDYGFGRHIETIQGPDLIIALELFWVAQIFYKIAIALVKASILLLYLRLFVHKRDRIFAWTLLAIVLAYGVAATLVSIFQCTPVQKGWVKSLPGHCISLRDSWYSNAGFSIATDALILILPAPMVYGLRMPLKQKLGLAVVFGTGGFVTVTSILRMTTLDLSSTSSDITYDITSSLWTVIEVNVAVVCACMPMLRAPLSALFPHILASTVRTSAAPHRPQDTHGSTTNPSRSWARLGKEGQDSGDIMMSPVHGVGPRRGNEDLIVTKQSFPNSSGIFKTTDFDLRYDDDQASSQSGTDGAWVSQPYHQ